MELAHKNKYYTVKRLRLLEFLIDKGFTIVKTIPDPNNPKYKWWLIENSIELEKAVNAYFNK